MSNEMNRRKFLKLTGTVVLATSVAGALGGCSGGGGGGALMEVVAEKSPKPAQSVAQMSFLIVIGSSVSIKSASRTRF